MPAPRDQLYIILIILGIHLFQTVKSSLGVASEFVAVESEVTIACKERECRVAKIFSRSILQRLTTCHRSGSGYIVGIEACKAL